MSLELQKDAGHKCGQGCGHADHFQRPQEHGVARGAAGEGGAAAAGGGGHPDAAGNTIEPGEVAELKKQHHLKDDVLRKELPNHGFTPQQIEEMLAGKPVKVSAPQKAEFDRKRHQSQRTVAEGVGQNEVANGGWFSSDTPATTPSTALVAPTGAELEANATVRTAINDSWADSGAGALATRHEEGGWIYMDTTSGAITTRRATRGAQASITLMSPPTVSGSVLVGMWHTHPNPTLNADENGITWVAGPSPADNNLVSRQNVPHLLRSDAGFSHYGPERRASLTGNATFP